MRKNAAAGIPCSELPTFIIKRLLVRLTFDNNCFNALYQEIPMGGYTKLVENLLDGIEVRLEEDYLEKKAQYDEMAEKIVYTGAVDAYFDYCLGHWIRDMLKFSGRRTILSCQ